MKSIMKTIFSNLNNVSKSYGYTVMMQTTGMNLCEYQLLRSGMSLFKNFSLPFIKHQNLKELVYGSFKEAPKVTRIKFSPVQQRDLNEAIISVFNKSPQLKAAMLGTEKEAISIMHWNKNLCQVG